MNKKVDPSNLIWKSEYNIGDLKTDNEHKNLFSIAKKALNVKVIKDDSAEMAELKSIIKSLYEYTATHFKNEEHYMYMINYPDLPRHKKIHKSMLETLNSFVKTLNTLSISEIEEQLYNFIESYFIRHIVDEDKRIEFWNKSLSKLRSSTDWKEQYLLGDGLLDAEHKELFCILQDAFHEVPAGKREEKIKGVLKQLYDFMKIHFKNEEDYMLEIKYPEYEKHKKIHQEIIENCNELVKEVNSIETSLFEKELAKLIEESLIKHIIFEDKKIVDWYKSVIA